MKILIVEDDPVTRHLLEALLCEWGYDVLITKDGVEAWEVLQVPEAPSLVISDWMMPHMDGVELCRNIRKMERSDYIYFILLTTKGKKQDIIGGLESGTDDFIVKPFDQEELKYRVKIGERIINLEQQMLRLATNDPLTGVLNRRVFMERLEAEMNKANRQNVPLSLILADVDHFKKINDTYGHQGGDLVLQHFTRQLSGSLRSYDFVGRYGGEEFVTCLPNTDSHLSKSVAERLRSKVEKMTITLPDSSQIIKLTASFGVASSCTGSRERVDSIIGRADGAMYRAKREGRNRACTAI